MKKSFKICLFTSVTLGCLQINGFAMDQKAGEEPEQEKKSSTANRERKLGMSKSSQKKKSNEENNKVEGKLIKTARGFQFVDSNDQSLHGKEDKPFYDLHTLEKHLKMTESIYNDAIKNILTNAYYVLKLALDPHINQNMITVSLQDYLEDNSNESNNIIEKRHYEILKKYMNLCKSIYTDSHTRNFLIDQKLINIEKKLNNLIHNKKTFEVLNENIEKCNNIDNNLILESPVFISEGSKTENSKEIASMRRDAWKKQLGEQEKDYVKKINHFLTTIEKNPIEIDKDNKDKDQKNSVNLPVIMNKLKDILLYLNNNYYFYFEKENEKEKLIIDKNFEISKSFEIPKFHDVDGVNRQLTAKAVISSSFLMKAGLLGNDNITIIDIGFRHKEKFGNFLNQFASGLMKAKTNPEAWFTNNGEVDYIAYIEKNVNGSENDKVDNLVIVYSGSNSQEDWATNLTVGSKCFLGVSSHDGITWLFDKSSDTFHSILKERILNYYKDKTTFPSKLEIIITGHSLGGALAELAAYYYKTEIVKEIKKNTIINNVSVKVYTFGAPAIFDKNSKIVIENELKKENICRVWTSDDIVVNWTDQTIPQRGVHIGKGYPLFNTQNLSTKFFDWWGPHGAGYYLSQLHTLSKNKDQQKTSQIHLPALSKSENLTPHERFIDIIDNYVLGTRLGAYKRNLKDIRGLRKALLLVEPFEEFSLSVDLAKHIIKYSPTVEELYSKNKVINIINNYDKDPRYAAAFPVTFRSPKDEGGAASITAKFQIYGENYDFKIEEKTDCSTARIQEFFKKRDIFFEDRSIAEELSCGCYVAKHTLVEPKMVQTLAEIFSKAVRRRAASIEYLQKMGKGRNELETALEIVKKVNLHTEFANKIVHLCNIKNKISYIYQENSDKFDKRNIKDFINFIINLQNDQYIKKIYRRIYDKIVRVICHDVINVDGKEIQINTNQEKFERLNFIFDKETIKNHLHKDNFSTFKKNFKITLLKYYTEYWFKDAGILHNGRFNLNSKMNILEAYWSTLEKFIEGIEPEQESAEIQSTNKFSPQDAATMSNQTKAQENLVATNTTSPCSTSDIKEIRTNSTPTISEEQKRANFVKKPQGDSHIEMTTTNEEKK